MEQEDFKDQKEAIAKELDRVVKKYRGKTVIANFYQLGREGNAFNPEMRKIRMSNQPVEVSHFERINNQWWNCGKLYEMDEEKTEEWYENLAVHKKVLNDKAQVERAAGQALVGALESVKANSGLRQQGEEGKSKQPQTHAVNEKLEKILLTKKMKKDLNPEDFSFVGSEEQCDEFIQEHKSE